MFLFLALFVWLDRIINNKYFKALFLVLIIAGFSKENIYNYLEWQARWVKDLATIQEIRKQPEKFNCNKYFVLDNFKLGYEKYRYYEWAGLFKVALNDESRIAQEYAGGFETILSELQTNKNLKARFMLKDFKRGGCTSNLTITAKTDTKPRKIAFNYFLAKITQNNKKIENLLNSVVVLEVLKKQDTKHRVL